MFNKKAQIGDTITWMVATLVIIVVLGISVLVTIPLGSEKKIKIEDKQKDFIATKSITNFLRNQENVGLLRRSNEEEIETKMNSFLEEVSIGKTLNPGGWNLELKRGNEKINVNTYRVLDLRDKQFDIKLNSDEIKLHFWKECQGGCIR